MNSINIIEANSQHFKEILEIMNYEILNKTSLYDYNERSLTDVEAIFMDKKEKNFPFYVAIKNNEVLGYAYYGTFNPKQGYAFTVEHSIYLKENATGQGIGKLLMSKLLEKAKQQNIKTMLALIDEENKNSIHFHEKYGFETIGVMRKVGYKFEKWLDCRMMQLIF
nr:GNAT family N-acetyltransferase [uncultured Flavobacterium sp.]